MSKLYVGIFLRTNPSDSNSYDLVPGTESGPHQDEFEAEAEAKYLNRVRGRGTTGGQYMTFEKRAVSGARLKFIWVPSEDPF